MGEVWRVLSLRENNRLCAAAAAAAVQTDCQCQSWWLYRLNLPVKSVCELSVQIASADTQSVFVSAVQSASARALACDRHPVCVTDMATQFAWLAMQFEQQL